MNKQNKALVIDALSLIHRAYHAYPPFKDQSGRPIGAIYGVGRIFLSVVNQLEPEFVLVAFDTKAPTFRHKQYADYKAKRPPTDEAMLVQIPLIEQLFEAAGAVILKQDGFEADDMIGSLVKANLKNNGLADQFIILSGDWDLAQLIDDDKIVLQYTRGSTKRTKIVNQQVFVTNWEFLPRLLPDYKALAGDASDNIPGVKGIGKKTAQILVSRFGDIKALYQLVDQQPDAISQITSKRVVNLLKKDKEQAFFSKQLATIKTDVPLAISDLNRHQFKRFNQDFIHFLENYNFKSLINMIRLTAEAKTRLSTADKAKQQLNLFG